MATRWTLSNAYSIERRTAGPPDRAARLRLCLDNIGSGTEVAATRDSIIATKIKRLAARARTSLRYREGRS